MALESIFGRKKKKGFAYKGPKTGKGFTGRSYEHKLSHDGISYAQKPDKTAKANKKVLVEEKFRIKCRKPGCGRMIGGPSMEESGRRYRKHLAEAHGDYGAFLGGLFK